MKPSDLISGPSSGGASDANALTPSDRDSPQQAWVDLAAYRNDEYSPGRGRIVRVAWYVISRIVFESGWFPLNRFKTALLRIFGARIGQGLVIKPNVRIKYPWRLAVGNQCWLGQEVWIDNLVDVRIGDHVCISQGAYLCTGSHDHGSRTFDLLTAPVAVETGAWVGAKAIVLPGCTVGANAVVAAGAVVRQSVGPADIVGGNPAKVVSRRREPTE